METPRTDRPTNGSVNQALKSTTDRVKTGEKRWTAPKRRQYWKPKSAEFRVEDKDNENDNGKEDKVYEKSLNRQTDNA